ncbi:hypothetical protein Sfulv_12120 [Streptomyces fulvorobeus]|uniref:Uncharacterized protein n=1 Tax=Streptomyces fulvorobeus TaxID=284028 RepID=A0A7J0C1T0_9ACTN|nr:hypothetical protein Sfulv_12120 [Streptomyces fulvorobeus]
MGRIGRPPATGWSGVGELLGAGLAEATLQWRGQVARTLQESVVASVREAAGAGFQVLLHADPAAYRTGANVGVDARHVLSVADGVVLPCTGGDAAREAVLGPFADASGVLAANFGIVSGMGGSPGTLARDAAHAASLGAGQLRLYHAGLASDQDLEAVTDALRHIG